MTGYGLNAKDLDREIKATLDRYIERCKQQGCEPDPKVIAAYEKRLG